MSEKIAETQRPADQAVAAAPDGQRHEPLSLLSITAEQIKASAAQPLEPGKTTTESVIVNGDRREYAIHTPATWDGKTQLPVLYYFNGMSPDGKPTPESFTGLSQRSDRDGFAVVYMRASNQRTQTYNNGQAAFANDKDENAYLNSVRNAVTGQIPADQTRQGLAGFSQGGSEAYALAAVNPWVASVQAVEGYMTGYEKPLNHPMSEQNIHALHDPIIPHNGTEQVCAQASREQQLNLEQAQLSGEIALDPVGALHALTCAIERSGNNIQSQSDIVNAFRRANGSEESTTSGTTVVTPDQTTRSYVNPANGTEVRQVVLNDGTHAWAGSTDHSGDIPIIGRPNMTFNASDSIAEFFLKHPLAGSGN